MTAHRLDAVRSFVSRVTPSRKPELSLPPHSFTDGKNREIRLRTYEDELFESLVTLYVTFDPADRAQGTPPLGEPAVREWLQTVLDSVSVVAFHGDHLVGHVMFVPDGVGRHELAIFVHQEYQRAGIGKQLLRTGLGQAKQQGLSKVWLTVESWKGSTQKLYTDVGFVTDNPFGTTYRMSQYL
ncbi:Acetyltransferase (GNAT) family protein [Haladaptatus litoreus]|uniref:Acetyltransferase (GNAT) family protein n=1 Tax=Haladaptatus litoreus TaxID=553468 RepID=A0A1N7E3A3_9EURY|nr:GNAT family N-acetyltransferase [Haladaptatus litoreus]SIR82521.1 Acetyltransferase (GNAT) family protein [Haladaptatus litoreus]